MSLTWKDAVATVLVGAAVILTYAKVKGFDWPLLSSWRMGTLALLVIGLGTCIIVGAGVVPTKDSWTITATVLGGTAAALAILGLIMDSKVVFMALAADIVALWLLATVHHVTAAGA